MNAPNIDTREEWREARSRRLDPLNTAYQLLDLTPRGRDEDNLAWPMEWLRRNDAYND